MNWLMATYTPVDDIVRKGKGAGSKSDNDNPIYDESRGGPESKGFRCQESLLPTVTIG